MSDEKIRVIQTAKDETAGAFEAILRVWEGQRKNAREIARTRRALFVAYVDAGFTEPQALELCKALSL